MGGSEGGANRGEGARGVSVCTVAVQSGAAHDAMQANVCGFGACGCGAQVGWGSLLADICFELLGWPATLHMCVFRSWRSTTSIPSRHSHGTTQSPPRRIRVAVAKAPTRILAPRFTPVGTEGARRDGEHVPPLCPGVQPTVVLLPEPPTEVSVRYHRTSMLKCGRESE
jgi:hypothetical protein